MTEEVEKRQQETQLNKLRLISGMAEITFIIASIIFLFTFDTALNASSTLQKIIILLVGSLVGLGLFFASRFADTHALKPRLQIVNIKTREFKPIHIGILLAVVLLNAFLNFPLMPPWVNDIGKYYSFIPTMVFLSMIAYITHTPRWYFFGVLFGTTTMLKSMLSTSVYLSIFYGVGILIFIIGTIVFIRFTRKYPLPEKDAQPQSIEAKQ